MTQSFTRAAARGFTFGVVQLSVDLDEDAGVAAAHDQQRNYIQSHKMKHVVCRLLPALVKTAVRDALSEVHALGFDGPEDEQLREEETEENNAIIAVELNTLGPS